MEEEKTKQKYPYHIYTYKGEICERISHHTTKQRYEQFLELAKSNQVNLDENLLNKYKRKTAQKYQKVEPKTMLKQLRKTEKMGFDYKDVYFKQRIWQCSCGEIIKNCSRAYHVKTKLHKRFCDELKLDYTKTKFEIINDLLLTTPHPS